MSTPIPATIKAKATKFGSNIAAYQTQIKYISNVACHAHHTCIASSITLVFWYSFNMKVSLFSCLRHLHKHPWTLSLAPACFSCVSLLNQAEVLRDLKIADNVRGTPRCAASVSVSVSVSDSVSVCIPRAATRSNVEIF